MKQKFRAWDKRENNWVDYPIYIDANGDVYWEHYERGLQEADDLIAMQSTGLVDKNGVEIFEGDIVRKFSNVNKYTDEWVSDVEPTYELSSIVFHEGSFKTTYKVEPSAPLNFTSYTITNDFEVIGNIYENSDLLEVSE